MVWTMVAKQGQPTCTYLKEKRTLVPEPPSKFERSPQPPCIFNVIAELFSSGRGCCRRRRGHTVGSASRVEALLGPLLIVPPLLSSSSQEGLRELVASPSPRYHKVLTFISTTKSEGATVLTGGSLLEHTNAEGVISLKPEASGTEKDRKKVELNAKAVNLFNCAISFEEYRRVSRCTTRKKIWDKFQITHEGTTIVKKIRIDMLNREYEIFSMKKGESIDEMFERFNIIIVCLDAMRITYFDSVLVRRVLRCLTKE
ncbi:uncharacterized protein LOC107607685 [Arachis ipaensis]|uniref:uncharacterized protein LOC107607685 n=1 Tax=Arachis ipaensis TaxID=130454 RepID=UPI000A2B4727|nr:uncharacterized protein LOC107607685 [Arachis ipaensis]